MPNANGSKDGDGSGKSKRVRTGCLTCRERHLKCDEGLPHCNNCRKSNRVCKRGVRLNFIDTWAEQPPIIVSMYGSRDWKVEFQDESRDIASEYQGGLQKYRTSAHEPDMGILTDPNLTYEYGQGAPPAPSMAHQALPPIHGNGPESYPDPSQHPDMSNMLDPQFKQDNNHFQPPHSTSTTNSSIGPGSVGSYNTGGALLQSSDSDERKEFLDNAEETLFMQVFVEEVGLWMDSMDPYKHFSRLLPFHSLSEPMLLNAFLACGARHLTLVNPAYTEEKALHYYDTATRHLLKNLQNPNRDTVICATTAVILNVYEIMSERALQRMNHIAGARALIKECGWNARSQGVGSACFWLNVGLEVLSCLHFNWQVAWDPEDWGVDMNFTRELLNGREEVWTHRMLYIVAKICNFRATIPRYQEADPRDAQIRTQQRYEQWTRLKGMADAWNEGVPRTMHPMAFLYPYQTTSKSAFPEVWLVKRSTIVARLFYHTAQLLLAQVNPYYGTDNMEMADMQTRHSQMICGIAAHVKDRGVASVAIRSLHHGAEVLTKRSEQEEVLQIFDKINKETGWRIGFVYKDLKEKWGWNEDPSPQQFAQTHTAARQQKEAQEAQQRQLQEQAQAAQNMQQMQQGYGNHQQNLNLPMPQHPPPQSMGPPPPAAASNPSSTSAAAPKKMPQGIPNPMYAKADFNLPQHPYQNFYVAPNHVSGQWNHGETGGQQPYYNV
ncbi:hypothetical protein LTR37_003363 [Vermiconidia calcicola]|uniref:Uncharacterized protein n=1 Tax=Vermiconidia calcicola TaxID=1690605 RepID=A0ACC3NQ82_9PEZI|nr:hypothetical protein LTR37_003363 [Vermiconidia calcicola]